MKVLLVVAPFAAVERPALGVSVLKARLGQAGVPCDIAYLNLAFADLFGLSDYERLVWDLPFRALVGEWVFTGCLYGADAPRAEAYVTEILRGRWGLEAGEVQLALDARCLATEFLEAQLEAVPWADSTSSASARTRRRILRRSPSLTESRTGIQAPPSSSEARIGKGRAASRSFAASTSSTSRVRATRRSRSPSS